MKKPLFILTLAAAVSPMLDAKVYSCGPGCYSDKAKGSRGYANLGKQIGSYTTIKSQPADNEAVAAKAAPSVQAAAVVQQARAKMPRPVPVSLAKRSHAQGNVMPAVVYKKVNSNRFNGRRSILEQELDNERNALAAAQKALAEGRLVGGKAADAAHQSRVRHLESAVLDRQQNIQSLQRELGRMYRN